LIRNLPILMTFLTDLLNFEPALELDYKIFDSDSFYETSSFNAEGLLPKELLASDSKTEAFFDGVLPNLSVPWGAVFYKF